MPIDPTIQIILYQKLKDLFPSSKKEIGFASIGGGCINETYRVSYGEHHFFCKVNAAKKFPGLFKKEKNGLALIEKQNIIKVPRVIGCFEEKDKQFLLLEWIKESDRTENFWKKFGEQLAALHHTSADYFGLDEDNYMGSVSQSNEPSTNWIDFFIHQRLQPLIDNCLSQKLLLSKHQAQFAFLKKSKNLHSFMEICGAEIL